MSTKAKCHYVIVAEDVRYTGEPGTPQKLVITQPTYNFILKYVPGQLTFHVLASLYNLKLGQAYEVQFVIFDEKENIVSRISGTFVPTDSHKTPNGDYSAIMGAEFKNVAFDAPGMYTVKLFVGDDVVGEQQFGVYKEGSLQ